MKSLRAVMSCVLVSGCVSASPLPLGDHTRAIPAANHRQQFLHSAAQAINAFDRDYGEIIERWRAWAVQRSLKDPVFWALLVAIGLLGLALITIVHQRNQRERQEVIAAEFLAQYHNAWVQAKRQAGEAIARHNALVEKNNRANEATELLTLNPAIPKTEPHREPTPSPGTIFLKGNLRPRPEILPTSDSKPGYKARDLRQSDPDLLAQLSALQQQLDAACERESNLERQLKKYVSVTAETKSNA